MADTEKRSCSPGCVSFPPPCLSPPPRSPSPVIKWGILGCAEIALKVGRSILLTDGCILSAVASRNPQKAEKFLNDLMGEKTYKKNEKKNIQILDYMKIVDKNIVDVLYLPIPSKMHAEWVCRAAECGIHVLCEKPAAVNSEDLRKIVEACKTNGVQFMDGVMYMHHKRTEKMLEVINDHLFGIPNRVTAVFTNQSFYTLLEKGDIRTNPEGDPLGCVGDLGWYCLRMGLLVFNLAYPKQVWCRADSLTEQNVPTDVTGEVFWNLPDTPAQKDERVGKGGKLVPILSFQCSFIRPFRQWVEILGDKKRILMDDFVIPKNEAEAKMILEVSPERGLLERETKICSSTIKYRINDCVQDCVMVQRMSEIVRRKMDGGELEEYWFDVAIKTQAISDALMKSISLGGQIVDVEEH